MTTRPTLLAASLLALLETTPSDLRIRRDHAGLRVPLEQIGQLEVRRRTGERWGQGALVGGGVGAVLTTAFLLPGRTRCARPRGDARPTGPVTARIRTVLAAAAVGLAVAAPVPVGAQADPGPCSTRSSKGGRGCARPFPRTRSRCSWT